MKNGNGCFSVLIPWLFLSLLLCSCDILRESSFEIEGWSPGEGYHPRPGEVSVSLVFSREPDRVSVERSFSLTEDGMALSGSFVWEGRRMIFSPAVPLGYDRDYLIAVSADARDGRGVSLERKFEASFSTRGTAGRPELVSVDPGYDGFLESRREVGLVFSRPVTVNSCVNYISWSPAMTGAWRLEDGGKTAVFTPAEPWKRGPRYRMSVSTAFSGANGLSMEKEYSSRFVTILDEEPPFLLDAWGICPGKEPVKLIPGNLDGTFTENSWWESNARLRLDFSRPVDTAGLWSRLSAEPQLSFVMETEPGFADTVIFRFSENPAHGSRFLIKLARGVQDAAGNESHDGQVFCVFTGGANSKPPSLRGIRFPLAPGMGGMAEQSPRSFSPEDIFGALPFTNEEGHFPYGRLVPFWIELYFDTAPGAAVDPFSVMDLFRVETSNNVLSFSPRHILDENFTWEAPRPGWESCYRLEIQGLLTNMTNPGMVSFLIGSGLLDSSGNRNERSFRISLLK